MDVFIGIFIASFRGNYSSSSIVVAWGQVVMCWCTGYDDSISWLAVVVIAWLR